MGIAHDPAGRTRHTGTFLPDSPSLRVLGAVRAECGLSPEELANPAESFRTTVLNIMLGMTAITGFYLFPMYLVGHWHLYAAISFVIAAAATGVLAFTWKRALPAADEGMAGTRS